MKKLFALVILLLVFVGFAQAEEIRIENGKVMTVNLVDSGVNVTPDAAKYPDAVAQVFADRGKEVAVEPKVEVRITDLFHYEMQAMQMVGVKYDVASNTVVGVTEPKAAGTPKGYFFWFPIFLIIGVVAMIVVNALIRLKKFNFVPATAVTAVCASYATFAVVPIGFAFAVSVGDVAFVAAILVALFSFAYNVSLNTKRIAFASSVSCCAMVVAATAVYYPLM